MSFGRKIKHAIRFGVKHTSDAIKFGKKVVHKAEKAVHTAEHIVGKVEKFGNEAMNIYNNLPPGVKALGTTALAAL